MYKFHNYLMNLFKRTLINLILNILFRGVIWHIWHKFGMIFNQLEFRIEVFLFVKHPRTRQN